MSNLDLARMIANVFRGIEDQPGAKTPFKETPA